ncbi:MAG: response regulator [Planctomycetota bacterium]
MSESESLRVLIVDDDPSALTLLSRYLTDAGHSVATAANGAEALRVLLAEGPPIVITDWAMPVMDGLELCRAIRTHEGIPFAYVIIVTATETAAEQVVQAFEAGADDYLSKPFNRKELLARMRAGQRIIRLQQALHGRNRELHRVNAEMAIAHSRLGEVNAKLSRMVMTDELTGLINRREALARLGTFWSSAVRHGTPLSCILLDVDRFKHCNDAYGHAVGDVVLREIARVMRSTSRQDESVCRIGGEEFLVICPHATAEEAAVGAERLRCAIQDAVIQTHDLDLRMTISLGVAEREAGMAGADDLLRAADHALYAAKGSGRNAVRVAGGKGGRPTSPDALQGASGSLPHRAEPESEPLPALPTVLVVDDDALSRAACRRALEGDGYAVVEAEDGLDALTQLTKTTPDVIIMDLVMPRLDGLECARRVKADANTESIPIIITSARSDAADIVAGLEAGADEYLTKPLNTRELLLRVKTMVRLRQELSRSNEVRGEQSRALGVLSDFSRTIATAESLDAILERTLAASAELTCSRRVCVLLPDAEHRVLTVARSFGVADKADSEIRVPFGAATAGEVFQSRLPVLVATEDDVRRRAGCPDGSLFRLLPSLATPLCAPECTVGVLVISGRADARPFTALELDYIELVCNIAAASLADWTARQARDDARDSIVVGLAKLAEHRDSDTGRHLDRVTRFSVLLAQELRSEDGLTGIITDQFISDLERAVPLHDIGKVAVPDYILKKPGPLTAEETAVMRTHASIGARTIRSLVQRVPGAKFLTLAEQIAFGHHEWFDGRGYPAGLRGEAIPLAARIVAVADMYDAITTRRVYKEAMSHDRAVAVILEGAGTQFDPAVVSAFANREGEFHRLARELADETPPVSARSSSGIAEVDFV